jgi:hypothetical protein
MRLFLDEMFKGLTPDQMPEDAVPESSTDGQGA